MATKKEEQSAAATTTEAGASLLEQAISATKQTKRDEAESMIRTLVDEVNKGTVKFDRNLNKTINAGIAEIDRVVSKQLAAVMHNADFQKLEGSWRGLHYLVQNSETSTSLKLRVFNCTKRELYKDLDKAVEFDQSELFKKVYENEFGSPGGEPYGALIGDYQFSNHPEDVDLLSKISGVCSSGHTPFLTTPSPELFGMDSWEELAKPRDLAKIFDASEYIKWNAFRDSEDSRYVTMCMPRTLSRLPYGSATKPIEEFNFEEVALGKKGESISVSHDQYAWMSTAYVMGTRLTDAFAKFGWCTAIRGAENGGRVSDLPVHIFKSDDGDTGVKCPTEIAITDRREKELSDLGFLPLSYYKEKDFSVFFGAQTCQKPKKYDRPNATANAAISARLPYIMASSRFAHYLKVIARDKIGSFMEVEDCSEWLNRWIMNYVSADEKPSAKTKARFPLREAKVEVKSVPGQPGVYNAVCHMRPWLQMEALTASMRMVAEIPKLSN